MIFILGILTGLIVSLFIVTLHTRYAPTIDRTLKQTQSKLKQKGSLIEPERDEVQQWINEITE